jgi:hypothetical protein
MTTITTIKEKFKNRLIHRKNVKHHLKFRTLLTLYFLLEFRDGRKWVGGELHNGFGAARVREK